MCTIVELYGQGRSEVEGIFVATPIDVRQSSTGADYQRLWLSDSTGWLLANAWADSYGGPAITCPAVIRAYLKLVAIPHGRLGKLIDPEVLSLPVVAANEPRRPDAGSLYRRLNRVLDALTVPLIRRFADDALTLPAVQEAFATGRGSRTHHHAYPLGLLEHSLEAAEAAAGANEHGPEAHDLAVVGALLHDLGKFRTSTDDPIARRLATLVGHERLTPEILAEPLRSLDAAWPEAGTILRYVWTGRCLKQECLSTATLVAAIVRTADRASAKLNRSASLPNVVILPPERR